MICLKQLVKINKNFQKSIHIRLDYNHLEKIKNYIPTRASVQVLNQYLYQITQNKGAKASILIGPYGKGKSHLLLVLLALLSKENRIGERGKVIYELIEKLEGIDKETGDYARWQMEAGKPYLSVLVSGGNGDLGKSFLLALKEGLEREGLERIAPDTYFERAIEVILQWKQFYPDTYQRFLECLEKEQLEEMVFIKRLEHYEDEALFFFQEIYPMLTAGSVFEPMVQMDVIALYQSVNEVLCTRYGYGGIVVIFDEFSKFVEGYPKERFSHAMEQLQNICELAEHSGEQALHVILVAHKAMKEYINVLPSEVINAYMGVEGRIGEIRFTVSMQNSYELIQNAIEKDAFLFQKEVEGEEWFCKMKEDSYCLPYFRRVFSKGEFETIVAKGCFPLTPVAAYLLLKISEKAVQNERTVFTFLAHDEPHSLARLVETEKEGGELYVTSGRIYDYFYNVFKNDTSNVRFHNEWLKAEYALSQVDGEQEKEVIKTIALILMVGESDEMYAGDDVIRLGAGLTVQAFEVVMEQLKHRQIVFFRSKIGTYAFRNNVGVDLEKEINRIKTTKFSKIDLCREIEKVSELEYELPKRYNQKYTMTRYFGYHFMTVENFMALSKAEYLFEDKFADGKILALVKTKEDFVEALSAHLKELGEERIVVVYPNEVFSQEENLKRILSVRMLRQDESFMEENRALEQELILYEEDLLFEINAALEQYYLPIYGKCRVLYYGECYETAEMKQQKSASKFNQLLSNICEQYYSDTPRINNEMINKRKLTVQIKRARGNLIEKILGKGDFSVYSKGTTPEATIFRAVFVRTGVMDLQEEGQVLSFQPDTGVMEVLGEIKKFIEQAAGERQCFSKLYAVLQGKKFGVRKGVLPLYLAYGLSLWAQMPVVYLNKKEVRLGSQTLENINHTPDSYYLYMEQGTVEKERYLSGLERLFYGEDKAYPYKINDKNRLIFLTDRIHDWYCALPQCSMHFFMDGEREEIQRGLKAFRAIFSKMDRNAREVLLERLPKAFETGDNYELLLQDICFVKEAMEGYLEAAKNEAALITKQVLGFEERDDLLWCLKDWYRKQNSRGKKEIHTKQTGRFMNAIKQLATHNEREIVEELSKAVLDLYIEDWKENGKKQYRSALMKILEEMEASEETEDGAGNRKIVFTNSQGVLVEKYFHEADEGGVSLFLENEIESALDDFEDSLETGQKVAVMVRMIEKLLKE